MPRYQDYSKIPKQIVAEVDDDFESLSKKLGIETQDLIKANIDDTTIKAGAVYNVPQVDTSLGVGTGAGIGEDIVDWWKGEAVPWLDKQRQSIYDWGMSQPGGQGAWDWINWEKNKETGYLPPGVGVGAGIAFEGGGIDRGGLPPLPPITEYVDPRGNRPADRVPYDTTPPGYYGFYGTEGDLERGPAHIASSDTQLLGTVLYPTEEPRERYRDQFERMWEDGEVSPQSAEVALRQMWEDVYLDPANKGRGGGIVGWIEERIGLTIDPETFFTEGASVEVLAAMLEEFRPDELNYLESQGILVPVEGYDLPSYGAGYNYNYPAVSYRAGGGGGSGPSQPYPRQSNLGLVSWSI